MIFFTRCLQEIQLDKHVKLLDSPGIVMATSDSGDTSSMILRNCVKVKVCILKLLLFLSDRALRILI